MFDRNTGNYLTVYKRMSSDSSKNLSTKWVYKSYIFDTYVKTWMALDNQQWLICHKTKTNQSINGSQQNHFCP